MNKEGACKDQTDYVRRYAVWCFALEGNEKSPHVASFRLVTALFGC